MFSSCVVFIVDVSLCISLLIKLRCWSINDGEVSFGKESGGCDEFLRSFLRYS